MDSSPGAASAHTPTLPEECVLRGRGGDRKALEELILCYRARIARFVIAETGERDGYEDLCQAIFVKMVLALPKLREAERFESWLFQIARNACRDHLRARLGSRRLFVSLASHHENVAPVAEPDAAGAVERGMAQLPEEQRNLLRLSLDERRSYDELATLSRSTVSSVKSRLWRARQNLREFLLAGDPE
ncbi:MAG: RNA polymerase sigma factor [Rhizomicrobium sp.]